MFSHRLSAFAALAALLLAAMVGGCSKAPAALRRVVQQEDIVGAWRYSGLSEESGAAWVITIEFAKDGTFRQTLVPPNAKHLIQQSGAWQLRGAEMHLEQLVVWDERTEGHWARQSQTWPMIESARRPGTLAIRGGLAADHSLDGEFDRLTDTECRLLTQVQ